MEQELGLEVTETDPSETHSEGPFDDPGSTLAHENVLGFAALLAILLAAAEGL
jgi:hypothetical protein